MDLHSKDKTQHPENVELLSAQPPITDFKGLLTTIISAVVCFGIYHILPYSTDANKGIALLIFVAALWFTEAVHITVTALMVPILAVVLGFPDTDIKKAMAGFADPTIYIFFGGFALATALHMQRLDRKIAVSLLRVSRGNMKVAVLMLFIVTAFLSMWISNTATAAMMLPLAMGMMSHLDQEKERKTYVFVLLGIAYCASIGGLGTVVGSPPNMIAAKALNLDFVGWMKLGLPMMLLILPLMLFSMYVIRPQYRLGRIDALRRRYQLKRAAAILRRIRSLGSAGGHHFHRRASATGDFRGRRLHHLPDRVHQQHRLRRAARTHFRQHRRANGSARTSFGIRHRHRRILCLHAAGGHAAQRDCVRYGPNQTA